MIPAEMLRHTKALSILLVEDDTLMRQGLAEALEDCFFIVDQAENGLEGLQKYETYLSLRKKHYDIIISDIQMPHMDGVELSRALRALRDNQPIIILSAHTETEFLLALINIGISQFITKPVRYPEMFETLTRVCSKLSPPLSKPSPTAETHEYFLSEAVRWNGEKKVLTVSDTLVQLTKYEIILMEILIRKFEQVCTSDDILDHFYLNGIDIDPNNLRGMMMRLRKKLPEGSLVSIYGMGYRLSHS